MKIHFLILCSFLISFVGCQRTRKIEKAPKVTESLAVLKTNPDSQSQGQDKFVVVSTNETMGAAAQGGNDFYLGLKKTSLNQEFLISQSVIEQKEDAFSGLKGHIVKFMQQGQKLVMVESLEGNKTTPILNPDNNYLVLTQFPIVEEKSDMIVFDFNAGLQELFLSSGWHGTEELDAPAGISDGFESTHVKSSFIKEISLTASNAFRIKQFARVEYKTPDDETAQLEIKNLEVRYFIRPYLKTNYEPFYFETNMQNFGFFINSGTYVDFLKKYAVTKRDSEKITTYAISANTPEKYKQAIREAVLYWNTAAGKKIVDVVDAPAGVTAPDDTYNVIQWIDNPEAGFAYADVLSDPRTGEILHSQVYLTSVFTENSIKKLAERIKEFKGEKSEEEKNAKSHLCAANVKKRMKQFISEAQMNKSTEEVVEKGALNILRAVVAHEVGHTLGLRHNFAGTLNMNYNFEKREELVKDFYLNGNIPIENTPTSSVMDYTNNYEDILTGELIANQKSFAEYDSQSMQILYSKASEADLKINTKFCSDLSDGIIIGCQTFDLGSLDNYNSTQDIKNASKILLSMLNLSKQEGSFTLTSETFWIKKLVGVTSFDNSVLSLEQSFPKFDSAWRDSLVNEVKKLLSSQQKSEEEIVKYLADNKTLIDIYITAIQNQLVKQELDLFALTDLKTRMPDLSIPPALAQTQSAQYQFASITQQNEFAKILLDKIQFVILSTETEKTFEVQLENEKILVPKFKFSAELRLQAAQLLSKIPTTSLSFGYKEKPTLKNLVTEKYSELLLKHIEVLDGDSLTKQEGEAFEELLTMKLILEKL